MSDMQTITTFLGWCTILNFAFLLLAAMLMTFARDAIAGIHSKMAGIDRQQVNAGYFSFLANYKVAVFVLNVVPYVALKIMA